MEPSRTRLNDTTARRAAPATAREYVLRDRDEAGFALIVGRRARTWVAQGDLRRDGSRRTIKLTIGRWPQVDAATARREARAALDRIRAGQDPRTPERKRDGITVADAFEIYRKKLENRNRSRDTMEALAYGKKLLAAWADVPLAALAADPQRAVDEHTRISSANGPMAANMALRHLTRIYRAACEIDDDLRLDRNPSRAVPWHSENPAQTGLDQPGLRSLWSKLGAVPAVNREAFLFMLFTGARSGDALPLRWKDVDIRNRRVTFREPKIGGPLHVPLSRPALRCLWRARKHGRMLDAGKAVEFVFPAARSKGHVTYVRSAQLGATPHGMRHTFATACVAAGVDSYTRRALLGHKAADVADTYPTRGALHATMLAASEVAGRWIVEGLGKPHGIT